MGIRETLNQNPKIATGVTIGIVALFIVLIWWQWPSSGVAARGGSSNRVFFTTDDGKSWFADSDSNVPPWQKGGKIAVRAFVFSCDGKPFVAYLMRYTPEAKKKMEASAGRRDPAMADPTIYNGTEVKAPLTGDQGWVKQSDVAKSTVITRPNCSGTLDVVAP